MSVIAGTSTGAIHRYESGWDRFEVRTLRRLAEALDATLEIRLEPRRTPSVEETPSGLVRRWRPLFWDVDLRTDHLRDNVPWVLRRVLEYGSWEDVHLARRIFGDHQVWEASRHRSVDARTRRLWEVVLGPGGSAR